MADDRRFRREVIGSLGMLYSEDAFDTLLDAFGDPDPEIRSTAGCYLAGFKNPKARSAFLQGLKDPDDSVREYSMDGLYALDPEGSLPHLRAILKTELARVPLYSAIDKIGELRDASSVPDVCRLLLDESRCCCVRCSSARALSQIPGHPEVVACLIENIRKKNKQNIRDCALEALREITKEDFGHDYDRWKTWLDAEWTPKHKK